MTTTSSILSQLDALWTVTQAQVLHSPTFSKLPRAKYSKLLKELQAVHKGIRANVSQNLANSEIAATKTSTVLVEKKEEKEKEKKSNKRQRVEEEEFDVVLQARVQDLESQLKELVSTVKRRRQDVHSLVLQKTEETLSSPLSLAATASASSSPISSLSSPSKKGEVNEKYDAKLAQRLETQLKETLEQLKRMENEAISSMTQLNAAKVILADQMHLPSSTIEQMLLAEATSSSSSSSSSHDATTTKNALKARAATRK